MIFTSLNAATTTGPGGAQTFANPADNFTMQVIVTGSPSSMTCLLQLSLDGTNWFDFGGIGTVAGGFFTPSAANQPPAFNAIRARLDTLSGGSSPTVTAIIAVLP